mmetsp:Transcript_18005/g.56477  ORF Transcript_18005/g.56477 Transcript_18005/m.56477 type:complete len:216 (+) Transcript_18005:938-1585(+)
MYDEKLADRVAQSVRADNAAWVRQNRIVLEQVCSALRFSGRAFLALGMSQLLLQSKIVSSLDEFAFGVFLLDAAHKIKRLLANVSTETAADELCGALKSIGDTHSIFAWVTSYQTSVIVFGFFGLEPLLQAAITHSALYTAYADFAARHVLLMHCVKAGVALVVLRFGGLSYAKTKITYWTRASAIGVYLATDKIARVLGHKRPLKIPRDTAKEY